MDFTKTGLPQDPRVEKAFTMLMGAQIKKAEKSFYFTLARTLNDNTGAKDPEVVAAALLLPFVFVGDDPEEGLTKRIEDIVTGYQAAERAANGAPDFVNVNSPHADAIRLLAFAEGNAGLEELVEGLELLKALGGLAVIFSQASDDPTEVQQTKDEIRQTKEEARQGLQEAFTVLSPLLGTTAEAALEKNFVKTYNKAARLLKEPEIAHPSDATSSKPATPKGPGGIGF